MCCIRRVGSIGLFCTLGLIMTSMVSGCDDGDGDPADPCEGVVCGEHGACDPDRGACECDPGYTGEACGEELLDCGDHGELDSATGRCECDDGYRGELCDACDEGYVLDGTGCVAGECVDDAQCDDGLSCNGSEVCGEDRRCVSGELVDCGENGVCSEPEGVCGCEEGYDRVDDACAREVLADLEDLGLEAGAYWDGADGSGSFQSGSTIFFNSYNAEWMSWDGFAYSTMTDRETPGIVNQYSAFPGEGSGGSATYAVAYESPFSVLGPPSLSFADAGDGMTIAGAYVTNTTFAYLSMRDGDAYCKQFGGETGSDPDWFLLTIRGITSEGDLTEPVEVYLADLRSDNDDEDYIIDSWTWVDLASLGDIVGLQFTLSSSDTGDWGMNTPAYFAIDGIMRHGR